MHGNAFVVGEALGEVVRHRLAEVFTADEDVDVAGVPSQEQGRLPGRVGPTDDHGVPAGHHVRLQLTGGVVDTASLEVREAGQVQAPVSDTAGDDHGRGDDVQLVVEPDAESPPGSFDSPVTARGDTSRVPNLTACSIPARASSTPDTPRGKPR